MCFMNREGSYNLKLTNGYNKEKSSVAICYPQVECSWRNKIKVPSQCMFEEAQSYRLLATLQLESRSVCRRLGFQPETLLGDDGHWPHGRNFRHWRARPRSWYWTSCFSLCFLASLRWAASSATCPAMTYSITTNSKPPCTETLGTRSQNKPFFPGTAHIWPLSEGACIQFAKILKCHHLQLPKEFFN